MTSNTLFLLLISISFGSVIYSSYLSIPAGYNMPDPGILTITSTIADLGFTIENIEYEMYITHTWNSDLKMYLERNGVNYTILESCCGNSDNFGASESNPFKIGMTGTTALPTTNTAPTPGIVYAFKGNFSPLLNTSPTGLWKTYI